MSDRRIPREGALRVRLLAGAAVIACIPGLPAWAQVAPAPAQAAAPGANVPGADGLAADEIYVDAAAASRQGDVVTAEGSAQDRVFARIRDHNLRAEEVTYDLKSGVATAAGNAELSAPDGAIVHASRIEMDSDLQVGVATDLARRLANGVAQMLRLEDVAVLLASPALVVVDACRHGVRAGEVWEPLVRRPVLFALVRALATAWPGDVDREALIANVFRTRHPDETHRARLRVEIGRLRKLIAPLAGVEATPRGFVLRPHGGRSVAVLAPPVDGEQGALVALLADGAAWSTSALALALGDSQRTVQRALAELESTGRVRAIGQARARRWLAAPLVGFTTILLLPTSQPIP